MATYEILTVTVKVTYHDGNFKERRQTMERDNVEWAAEQFHEINDAAKVEIFHNNELLAQYPKE